MVAAGVTDLNEGLLESTKAKYGEIKFYLKKYNDEVKMNFVPLKFRSCDSNDFDFGDDTNTVSALYPLDRNAEIFKSKPSNMNCIHEKFQIWGDFDSYDSQSLMIVF